MLAMPGEGADVLFFRLNTWVLVLLLVGVMAAATAAGLLIGRRMGAHGEHVREPFGVLQAALIGFMGLILAFGLSLALGRYEDRRAAVVEESNAIGTTYLRAQTLAEPVRTSPSTSSAATPTRASPSPRRPRQQWVRPRHHRERAVRAPTVGPRRPALDEAPVDSAPRLYVESLNDMFDAQSSRVYALTNRVPTAVLALEVAGAAIAVAALALHLATFGRGLLTVLTVSLLVAILLVVTFDLDRPTRGVIDVPSTPLLDVRAGMARHPPPRRPAAGDHYSPTVTAVKGSSGSIHGKTTNSSSAQVPSTSSAEMIVRPTVPPGR